MTARSCGSQLSLPLVLFAACAGPSEPQPAVTTFLNQGDGTFMSRVQYGSPTTETPYIAVSDLDGDGKLDIAAVTHQPCCELSVLLGNGDGTFRAGWSVHDFEGPLAVADFNADGKPDLVIALQGNRIRLLLGRGDGSFTHGIDFGVAVGTGCAVGPAPQSIAIADFNGDNSPDVVVATQTNAATVYLGNGDASFQPQKDVALIGEAFSVEPADFNSDGKPDLAVTELGGGSCPAAVEILLGRGDGTFQPPTRVADSGSSIAAADFDRDGYLDLALAGTSGTDCAVRLLLNQGPAMFSAISCLPARPAWGIRVSDVDRDGTPDIVAGGLDRALSILRGLGDGSFAPHVDYETGGCPSGITVADLNNDGSPDIAIGRACP